MLVVLLDVLAEMAGHGLFSFCWCRAWIRFLCCVTFFQKTGALPENCSHLEATLAMTLHTQTCDKGVVDIKELGIYCGTAIWAR